MLVKGGPVHLTQALKTIRQVPIFSMDAFIKTTIKLSLNTAMKV